MEKYRFLWSLLLVSLSSILFSCSDDDEVTGPLTIKTGLLKEIGYTTAVCGGEISGGSGKVYSIMSGLGWKQAMVLNMGKKKPV